MKSNLNVSFIKTKEECNFLATLFVENVDNSYISHGEIICGRALSITEWAPNIQSIIEAELVDILNSRNLKDYCIIVRDLEKILGFSIYRINNTSINIKYAVIEDIIIAKTVRRQGAFRALSNFIETQLSLQGIDFCFFEYGANNLQSVAIFENMGFKTTSATMMKAAIK